MFKKRLRKGQRENYDVTIKLSTPNKNLPQI